jgi:hypothetical protein
LIIGLKRTTYRHWRCQFSNQVFHPGSGKGQPPTCGPDVTVAYVDRSYTGQVQYRLEYKTTAAPDSPGTGSDPTTGWVQLKASTTRGTVALHNQKTCFASPQTPVFPSEDFWSESVEVLGAAPNTYDIKAFYQSATHQADPCPGLSPSMCTSGECPGFLTDNDLIAEVKTMSIDYVTSIS